jgi:tetratricopeptide (TPR) repeat protein/transcriptional regulator with XRE-family HTH domain
MKSFSELLSEYIERTGVSDTELARRLGVSRQTVFRWRAGITQRPRHRQDILDLSARLQLGPEERDHLLLAAGFQPTASAEMPQAPAEALSASSLARGQEKKPVSDWVFGPRRWLAVVGLIALIAVGLFMAAGAWRIPARWLGSLSSASPKAAQPGETLILISPFMNYAGDRSGYNVAGRIREALQPLGSQPGLANFRVDILNEPVNSESEARRLGSLLDAELVVWGEYDSGRLLANITPIQASETVATQQQRWMVTNPEQLNTTINADLPDEMQWMSLWVLGQIQFWSGRDPEAEATFKQVLAQGAPDPASEGIVDYFLALLENRKPDRNLDQVIAYDSQAVANLASLLPAFNNRGAAYLERSAPGDSDRAKADFEHVIGSNPDFAAAHLNLALLLLHQNPRQTNGALGLLAQAAVIEPESAAVQNALCWVTALSGEPSNAMASCDRAVALDPSGYSDDSRAIALAMLGRNRESIAGFQRFLDRLQASDLQAYARFSSSRQAWIAALENGIDPFDAPTRQNLLQE